MMKKSIDWSTPPGPPQHAKCLKCGVDCKNLKNLTAHWKLEHPEFFAVDKKEKKQ